jgi:hypothetical protein
MAGAYERRGSNGTAGSPMLADARRASTGRWTVMAQDPVQRRIKGGPELKAHQAATVEVLSAQVRDTAGPQTPLPRMRAHLAALPF